MKFYLFFALNVSVLLIGLLFLFHDTTFTHWLKHLNQAPWTPSGWFFCTFWVLAVFFYSIYLHFVYEKVDSSERDHFWQLYVLQWMLTVFWSLLFFSGHFLLFSALNGIALFTTIMFTHQHYSRRIKARKVLLFPYITWLVLALSLNVFIVVMN